MPSPTPFHPRTSELCVSLAWKEWAGCYAVRSFDTTHDREYFALRQAAGVIDVTPLYKYEVRGPDAGAFLAYLTVRDPRKLREGRVVYLCWCDERGKVVDDGTISRLGPQHYRLTAAEPALSWMLRHATRFDVRIEDRSRDLAALALQGPRSRAVLRELAPEAADGLGYFRVASASIAGRPVHVSRTGYTGDLGYEIWVDADGALPVWDALVEAGRPHLLQPVGLDALDVARVEAGFVMNGVDYFSAHHCLIEARKSSPFEIGLGWTVRLDRGPFVGAEALAREQARGSRWALVGLVVDWDEYEALFAEHGLPPAVSSRAWRDPVPVYTADERQVGYATSGAWSPQLKANLALATVEAEFARPDTPLRIEVTVQFERRQAAARVRPRPFYDPPARRS